MCLFLSTCCVCRPVCLPVFVSFGISVHLNEYFPTCCLCCSRYCMSTCKHSWPGGAVPVGFSLSICWPVCLPVFFFSCLLSVTMSVCWSSDFCPMFSMSVKSVSLSVRSVNLSVGQPVCQPGCLPVCPYNRQDKVSILRSWLKIHYEECRSRQIAGNRNLIPIRLGIFSKKHAVFSQHFIIGIICAWLWSIKETVSRDFETWVIQIVRSSRPLIPTSTFLYKK